MTENFREQVKTLLGEWETTYRHEMELNEYDYGRGFTHANYSYVNPDLPDDAKEDALDRAKGTVDKQAKFVSDYLEVMMEEGETQENVERIRCFLMNQLIEESNFPDEEYPVYTITLIGSDCPAGLVINVEDLSEFDFVYSWTLVRYDVIAIKNWLFDRRERRLTKTWDELSAKIRSDFDRNGFGVEIEISPGVRPNRGGVHFTLQVEE